MCPVLPGLLDLPDSEWIKADQLDPGVLGSIRDQTRSIVVELHPVGNEESSPIPRGGSDIQIDGYM
jgi:hypothetical protein